MATEDEVAIRITLRNASRFYGDAKRAARGVEEIGTKAKIAGVGLAAIKTGSSAAGAGLRAIGSQSRYAAIGVGALAAAGAKMGIEYDASLEQSSIALRTLLGSQEAANRELKAGQQIARNSSLLNQRDTARAQQQLIGVGISADLTRKLLEGTSDAMVALGRDPQEFNQVINAFGQIQSKGTVMGDEITQQLGEVFPAMKILQEQLGLTEDQVRNLGAQGISSGVALEALARGLEKDYAGAAHAAEHSWNAEMNRLQDDTRVAFGAIMKSTFDWGEKAVLPTVDKAVQKISEIFGRKGLSNEEKLRQARQVIEHELAPIWDDIGHQISEADIPGKLGAAIRAATPAVLDASADVGKHAVGAFIEGWMHAGPLAQALTGLFLANKLRKSDLGKALGGAAGLGGGKGGKGGVVGALFGGAVGTKHNPMYVRVVSGPTAPDRSNPRRRTSAAQAVARGVGLYDAAQGANSLLQGKNVGTAIDDADPTNALHALGLPSLHEKGARYSGLNGWANLAHDLVSPFRGGTPDPPYRFSGAVPFDPGAPSRRALTVQSDLNVDGKTFARATTSYTAAELARLNDAHAARR